MEKIKLDPETSALILIDLQHGIVALRNEPSSGILGRRKSSVACSDI